MVARILALALAASPVFAGPTVDGVELEGLFAPPHHEPVVSPWVARYRARLIADVSWGRFSYQGQLIGWGAQKWRNGSVVGHNMDAWRNSDWGVEKWLVEHKHRLFYRLTDRVDLMMEYRDTTQSWTHAQSSYWLLTGFRVRLY